MKHNTYERNPSSVELHNVELPSTLFEAQARKKKSLRKQFLMFREMKLFSSNIKKIIIFSQEKAFLISWETETPKKCLIFQKELPKPQKPKFLISPK